MSQSEKKKASAMPSPTFTYATAPRSSPMLSSSFTPFYPRSHISNFLYEWPHVYNQTPCYTSSASDPYKVCWVSDNGNGWTGGAWQSGNSVPEEYVYADDEAEDSAFLHSDSLSYYAESPGMEQEFYACSTSNTAFVPTDPGTTSFSVPYSEAKLEQASRSSKVREHSTPSLTNSFIQDQAYCAFGKQGSAKNMSNEMANTFSSGKMDARPFSIQVSSQMCPSFGIRSPDVWPKMKQTTTDMTENRPVHLDSSKPFKILCCNSKSLEAIESKHSVQATSNATDTLKLLEGINLDAPAMSISAEINQKEADIRNSLSPQSSSSQLPSTSGQCPYVTIPKQINTQAHYSSAIDTASLEQRSTGPLLNRPSLVMETECKPCVEAIDHDAMQQRKTGSSNSPPGNAWLYLNGPQLLVKCIHNLSKVLLSNQSRTDLNILDPTDCLAIENAICILSHRLYQSSVNEETPSQDQSYYQVAEQESNISYDKLKFSEEAGKKAFQQKNSFLLEGMKHKAKTVSPSRVLENEALDGSSKVTANTCVEGDEREDQSSHVKKEIIKQSEDLLMLQCNVTKLQEEVAYERAESNVTVMTYKKLWSEAQEALKLSRLEIKELRAELASLQQDFTTLKHSEGPGGTGAMPSDLELTKYDMKTSCVNKGGFHGNSLDVKTGSNQWCTARDLYTAPNDNTCFGSSKEPFLVCSEVVTNYFAPENISNCRENWSPHAKGEEMILRHDSQISKIFEVSASETSAKHVGGRNLDDEVTQRLTLLLARQCLDLNKTCIDGNVELPSGLGTSLNSSSNLPREGEAMQPERKGNTLISSETSYMVMPNKEIGGVKADLSCQMKPAFDLSHGDHSMVQRRSNTRSTEGVDVEDVNVSTFQEDEIEIICLKPGVTESSFTCLKGESEWEHVVVNVLDDQKTTGLGDNATTRKVDQ